MTTHTLETRESPVANKPHQKHTAQRESGAYSLARAQLLAKLGHDRAAQHVGQR